MVLVFISFTFRDMFTFLTIFSEYLFQVREANPRPIFENEVYTAGISTMDSINRELFTVKVTRSR